jgi:hypothetical protein
MVWVRFVLALWGADSLPLKDLAHTGQIWIRAIGSCCLFMALVAWSDGLLPHIDCPICRRAECLHWFLPWIAAIREFSTCRRKWHELHQREFNAQPEILTQSPYLRLSKLGSYWKICQAASQQGISSIGRFVKRPHSKEFQAAFKDFLPWRLGSDRLFLQ